MHSSKGETFSLMLSFSGHLHVFLPHFFLFLSFCFPSGFTLSCVHFVTRAHLDPSLWRRWHLRIFSVDRVSCVPLLLRSCCPAMRAGLAFKTSFMAFFCLSLSERQVSFTSCLRSRPRRWNRISPGGGVTAAVTRRLWGFWYLCLRQRGDS